MAQQVTIDVPDGVAREVAARVAADAVTARATADRVATVLSQANAPAGPGLLAQAALREEAWRDLDERWGLLTAAEVTRLTGGDPAKAAAHTANLRRRRRLAGVRRGQSLVYPGFQLSPRGTAFGVCPAWTDLVTELHPTRWDAADLLLWAASPNTWLDGETPAEEVQQHPEAVTPRLAEAAHRAVRDASRVA